MKINKTIIKTYKGEINIGLLKGYSDTVWTVNELKKALTEVQETVKSKKNILLSAKVTLCDIVFLGQDEPSVTISFINYPKFPLDEHSFKEGILCIAKKLMNKLKQNRVVAVFDDETVMLDISPDIDDSINL